MSSSFLQNLNGNSTSDIPFWFMRQAGRYLPEYKKVREEAGSFLGLCKDPQKASEVTLQPIRRFDMSAAIIFSDILLIAEALGQELTFTDGIGPQLGDLDIMFLDGQNTGEKLSYVGEAIERTRERLPIEKNIIGFAGAPWTVACYMIEGKSSNNYSQARLFAWRHRKQFEHLLDILIHATADYLKMQIKAGAQAIQIFDSWAGVLSVEEFRSWVIKPTKDIIQRVRQVYPHIPVIGFPKGGHLMLPAYIKETEVNCLGLDSGVPVAWAHMRLQKSCALQGNLDPQYLLLSPDMMKTRLEHILTELGKGPFVFNLGHGIDKKTPVENVEILSQWLKKWIR